MSEYTAIPSREEPVIDRYRKWSNVWWPWIKRVLETVKTSANAVVQINETIDEINGKWALDITENGRVRGAITLDASQAQSVFGILADKFIVVHPSDDNTTVTAFVVGLVNGVSTVGINGNLIVDDTILARHLAVNTLDAVSANMGTLTTGKIQSSDGKFVIDCDNKTIRISR